MAKLWTGISQDTAFRILQEDYFCVKRINCGNNTSTTDDISRVPRLHVVSHSSNITVFAFYQQKYAMNAMVTTMFVFILQATVPESQGLPNPKAVEKDGTASFALRTQTLTRLQ